MVENSTSDPVYLQGVLPKLLRDFARPTHEAGLDLNESMWKKPTEICKKTGAILDTFLQILIAGLLTSTNIHAD
jgi:hypothetical protein